MRTAMRQWRFVNLEQIISEINTIEKYVLEAKENVGNGKLVKPKRNKPLIIPELLTAAFTNHTILKSSFNELSLTKKREYVAHIDSAKMEKTKQTRLKKIIPLIIDGVGVTFFF